jgi:hypothetical protein
LREREFFPLSSSEFFVSVFFHTERECKREIERERVERVFFLFEESKRKRERGSKSLTNRKISRKTGGEKKRPLSKRNTMLPAELEAAAAIPAFLGRCVHCGKDDFGGDEDDEEGNEEEQKENYGSDDGEAAKTEAKKKTKGDAAAASSSSSFGPRTMILCTCCQVRMKRERTG